VTEKYNRIRFGGRDLTSHEETEVNEWLDILSSISGGSK